MSGIGGKYSPKGLLSVKTVWVPTSTTGLAEIPKDETRLLAEEDDGGGLGRFICLYCCRDTDFLEDPDDKGTEDVTVDTDEDYGLPEDVAELAVMTGEVSIADGAEDVDSVEKLSDEEVVVVVREACEVDDVGRIRFL